MDIKAHPTYLEQFGLEKPVLRTDEQFEASLDASAKKALAWIRHHALHEREWVQNKLAAIQNAPVKDEELSDRVNELADNVAAYAYAREGRDTTWFDLEEEDAASCDSGCWGWNGHSRRCDCGNRRVQWSYTGSYDNDMTVFGPEVW
jgi:hypothetical protein